jgi:hypothetical protein
LVRAIAYPHIIGVGQLTLHEPVVFAVLKAAAVAITIGGM